MALFLVSLLLLHSNFADAQTRLNIQIGQMQSDVGEARNVNLDVRLLSTPSAKPTLNIQAKAQIKSAGDTIWSDAALMCDKLSNPSIAKWQCEHGNVSSGAFKLPFSLAIQLPINQNQPEYSADIALSNVSFNDAAGLHAGDKINATMQLVAAKKAGQWRWKISLDWQAGEIFWQPFYIATAGHQLHASGYLNQNSLAVEQATLDIKDVGQVSVNANISLPDKVLTTLKLTSSSLDLAGLYPLMLKPLLEGGSLSQLEVAGKADIQFQLLNGAPQSFNVHLQDVDIEDGNGRFALYKLNASIPWDYDDIRNMTASYQGGHVLKLPLGAASLSAQLNRYALTANQLKLPVLDGALVLSDVSTALIGGDWHGHLRANILPVSMPDLSHALGWPRMEGAVSATIPLVTYSAGYLTTDGEMLFNIFDGTAIVRQLTMQTPLGISPKLNADVEMRNLDLGALTRTFSFGAIEGKLDVDVRQLELNNWQAVKFDANMRSSAGRYPKKISQRAVENISSLGGPGASLAIQRSFLRFFKEFNYEKIGLSCRLINGTCLMDGVESTPQGYVIVKGSGVPAITVMGYNHNVNWLELGTRIKRITQSNVKPVIE
ncbi:MAG TPA: hypothetical protein VGC12_08935 [Methyloradius sp.]